VQPSAIVEVQCWLWQTRRDQVYAVLKEVLTRLNAVNSASKFAAKDCLRRAYGIPQP